MPTSLSTTVKAGFDVAPSLNMVEAWVTSLSYTLQLYFDFSGYSDMAIGVGLMFNIVLPVNFNSPYKATNIIDFWKRWHMTLTNFITTYLYSPILRSFQHRSPSPTPWWPSSSPCSSPASGTAPAGPSSCGAPARRGAGGQPPLEEAQAARCPGCWGGC